MSDESDVRMYIERKEDHECINNKHRDRDKTKQNVKFSVSLSQ